MPGHSRASPCASQVKSSQVVKYLKDASARDGFSKPHHTRAARPLAGRACSRLHQSSIVVVKIISRQAQLCGARVSLRHTTTPPHHTTPHHTTPHHTTPSSISLASYQIQIRRENLFLLSSPLPPPALGAPLDTFHLDLRVACCASLAVLQRLLTPVQLGQRPTGLHSVISLQFFLPSRIPRRWLWL